jgi:hypothetical protein
MSKTNPIRRISVTTAPDGTSSVIVTRKSSWKHYVTRKGFIIVGIMLAAGGVVGLNNVAFWSSALATLLGGK